MLTKEIPSAENELVARLKSQDPRGMEHLYDNYSSALFGAILKMVTDADTAEDLLQEVFVKIWKNIGSYDRSKGRLYTWMLNIARNAAIDKLRSRDYKSNSKNQSLDISVGSVNRTHHTVNITDTIGLKKVIEGLKPEQQTMIDLLYFQGYTQAEVAEELNMPLGTVKTRIRAAIIELRKRMGV